MSNYKVNPPYVVWWGNAKALRNVNIVAAGPSEDIKYWADRGATEAGFVGIGKKELGYVDKGEADKLRAEMEKRAAEGFDSIALEVERNTDSVDAAVLRNFKEAHPDIFVTAWMIGLDNRHPYSLLKDGVDLFINEVYTDYGHRYDRFDKFVKMAREKKIIEKSIFAVSVENVDSSETKEQLTYVRSIAPEMPGIAFFYYRGIGKDMIADDLSKTYFLDPVMVLDPETIQASPPGTVAGKPVTLTVRVRNIGYSPGRVSIDIFEGDPAEKGKRIAGDVGGRIMEEQSETKIKFSWLPPPGNHRIYIRLSPQADQPIKGMTQSKITIKVVKRKWWQYLWPFDH